MTSRPSQRLRVGLRHGRPTDTRSPTSTMGSSSSFRPPALRHESSRRERTSLQFRRGRRTGPDSRSRAFWESPSFLPAAGVLARSRSTPAAASFGPRAGTTLPSALTARRVGSCTSWTSTRDALAPCGPTASSKSSRAFRGRRRGSGSSSPRPSSGTIRICTGWARTGPASAR